jgi:hypothetical protein
MSTCISLGAWWRGHRLASKLVRSILTDTDWVYADDVCCECVGCDCINELTHLDTTVRVYWSRLRCLDRVSVSYRGQDVWLPCLARCRVRSAVRIRMQIMALMA